jgi:restriction endonuclease
VFVLGVLKRSDNTVSRRQEIGRGLRLSVDQRGERTDDPVTVHSVNELTVVTDESYTAFVDGLQREVSESPGPRPGGPGGYPRPADGRRRKPSPPPEESAGPRELVRPVAVDSDVLIAGCVAALNDRLRVAGLRYVVQQGELRAGDLTGRPAGTRSSAHTATGSASSQVAYDLIGEIAAKTQLTRRTVASILRQVRPATFARYRQNPGQFIAEAARLIGEQRDSLSTGNSRGAC